MGRVRDALCLCWHRKHFVATSLSMLFFQYNLWADAANSCIQDLVFKALMCILLYLFRGEMPSQRMWCCGVAVLSTTFVFAISGSLGKPHDHMCRALCLLALANHETWGVSAMTACAFYVLHVCVSHIESIAVAKNVTSGCFLDAKPADLWGRPPVW